MNIIWQPTPTQAQALSRTEFEVLFGGARGGGKTDGGMAFLMYDLENPLYRALVVRRNAEDLKDWVDRARRMYLYGEFIGSPPEIRFKSGAIIRTGHLKDENAYTKYQGHEYQKMLIEELTQIPREDDYLKLIASCRSTVVGIKPQVFATTNPGNTGHAWVKKRFIDVGPAKIPFIDPITTRSRIYIPAKIDDNPYLMQNDPDYVKFLDGLPEGLRKAWREGSWEDIEIKGAIYGSEMREALQQGRIGTVPYNDKLWTDTYWDLGIRDANIIWFVQQDGNRFNIIDYYEITNKGLENHVNILKDKGYIYRSHNLPHDAKARDKGSAKSFEHQMREWLDKLEVSGNIKVVPNIGRDEGIEAIRTIFKRLWFDSINCERGILGLRAYRTEEDEKRDTLKAEPLHDWASHIADGLRMLGVVVRLREDKIDKAKISTQESIPITAISEFFK